MEDAVRFTVELVGQKSDGIDDVARALGNDFAVRGEATRFARDIVDAVADDDRLHSPEQVVRLLSIFSRILGVCAGIWQTIGYSAKPDDCLASLDTELLQYARLNGKTGVDREGRIRGLRLLDEMGEMPK
jgi:hypothetical protein